MADGSKCEAMEFMNGTPCPAKAPWRVQVGLRQTDAQLSCGRHLSMTCGAMSQAEGRDVALTVTAVRG